MRANKSRLEDLKFYTMPQDQGQIVIVSYAEDCDGLWRQSFDRSDRTESYSFAEYAEDITDDEAEFGFQPQNGLLPPHGKWHEVDFGGDDE